MTRSDFITLALTWEGTPTLRSGAQKGVGASCGGLWLGVFREAGLTRLATLFAPLEGFAKPPPARELYKMMREGFHKLRGNPEPADLLLIDFGGGMDHVALLVEPSRILHADRGCGRVVAQRLVRPVHSIWRIRELA
jgi:hypothetical protein